MNPTWISELDRLAGEWSEVLDSRRRRAEHAAQTVASQWDIRLAELAAEHGDLVAGGLWVRGPADVFAVLGLGRSELHHSAMLAWLLDPIGRHGLGDSLLRTVLAKWFPAATNPGTIRRVETEVARGDTRADIVLWAARCTLVIENKVDASEGWRQCDRLFERFNKEHGAQFLFITPDGHQPRTATGAAAEAFVAASWPQLRHALTDCLRALDSRGKAGTIVEDYMRTLREQFG